MDEELMQKKLMKKIVLSKNKEKINFKFKIQRAVFRKQSETKV